MKKVSYNNKDHQTRVSAGGLGLFGKGIHFWSAVIIGKNTILLFVTNYYLKGLIIGLAKIGVK